MAKPTADVRLNVSQQSAAAALKAFENRFVQMMGRMDQSLKKQNKASEDINKSLSGWAGKIGKAVVAGGAMYTAFAGVRKIIDLVRREFDALLQTQQKAYDRQLDFNAVMSDIHYSLPPGTSIGVEEIRNKIVESSAPYKKELALAVRGGISAGIGDPRERIETAIRIGELRPGLARLNPEAMQHLTEAVLEGQRSWGGTVEQQLGMMHAASSASRTTQMDFFAKNIASLVPKLKQYGFSEHEALSFGSALSIAMVDPEGTTTATNAQEFARQLMEEIRVTAGRTDLKGGAMFDFIWSDDPDAKRIRDRLAGVLQQGLTDEEAKQLEDYGAGKLRGRTKGKVALIQMLTDKPMAGGKETLPQLYAEAQKSIPTLEDADDFLAQEMAKLHGQDWYAVSGFHHATERFGQARELDPRVSMRGGVISQLETVALATRDHKINADIQMLLARLQSSDASPEAMLTMFLDSINSRQASILKEAGLGTAQVPRMEGGKFQRKADELPITAESPFYLGIPKKYRMRLPFGPASKTIPEEFVRIGDAISSLSQERQDEAKDLQNLEDAIRELIKTLKTDGIKTEEKNKLKSPKPADAGGLGT